ncbi:MAG: RnfH family protein [Gammaproteobacteria bacterium]|jgi:putative ubiquitin-RnfH superfamily antitoxin RatB of RatAB toxin-antitoxin module|nr:RnfH family protein [Gammaproteobacteria bacterium]
MDSISGMTVEVAYALPEKQTLLSLQVPVNTTVMQAIESSGILALHPEIDLARQKLGIFGRLAKPSEALLPGDRVEIYRPLKADPKEVRRRLAAEGKTMGKSYKIDEGDGDEG